MIYQLTTKPPTARGSAFVRPPFLPSPIPSTRPSSDPPKKKIPATSKGGSTNATIASSGPENQSYHEDSEEGPFPNFEGWDKQLAGL